MGVNCLRPRDRRGRLSRLRELARASLAVYRLDDTRLRFIQYNENTIYRVDAPGAMQAENDHDEARVGSMGFHVLSFSFCLVSLFHTPDFRDNPFPV